MGQGHERPKVSWMGASPSTGRTMRPQGVPATASSSPWTPPRSSARGCLEGRLMGSRCLRSHSGWGGEGKGCREWEGWAPAPYRPRARPYLVRGSSSRRRRRSVATTRASSPSPSRSRPSRSTAVSNRTTGRQRRAREKAACSFVSTAPLLSAQRLEQGTWGGVPDRPVSKGQR